MRIAHRLLAGALTVGLFGCAAPTPAAEPAPLPFVGPPAPVADVAQAADAPTDSVALALPEGTRAAPETPSLPPTRLALESFRDGMVVVLGRTLSTTNVGPGGSVARVLVEDQLAGPDLPDGPQLTTLAHAGDLQRGRRDLFFLKPFRSGPRWSIERLLDGRDPDFRAKLELTRRTAALLAIEHPSARDAATFELVMDALTDARRWTRRYAVAELGWLASTRAELFTDIRRRRLQSLAAETAYDVIRQGVELVSIVLGWAERPLPEAPPEESSRL